MTDPIWLRFPKRGYGPMHAMVMSGQLDPYAPPGAPALFGAKVVNKHRNPHTIRDCDILLKRGVLAWVPTPGYIWTPVGRAVAISMRHAHQINRPTESHPLPDLTGILLNDLLEWIDTDTRIRLLNLPAEPEISNPYWTRIMCDLGVVKVRQHTGKIELEVPPIAVLEFFKEHPRFLPYPGDLTIPPNMRANDREFLEGFHFRLRQMRKTYDMAGPTEDDWDIV